MAIAADCLLVTCPQCGAWPMAAKGYSDGWATRREMPFRCPDCGHQETLNVEGAKTTPYHEEAPPTQPER
jgi:predicted RNA-binding Zn-ribbon protein involved in translation (DUF1610 family)